MANKTTDNQDNNAIDNLNDSLTGLGQKVRNNQKVIFIITGILAVIVLAVLVYIYAFRDPKIQAGNEEIGQADIELALGNDSIALQKYMEVADKHSYDAGNRAALQAGILLYQKGDYEEAIKYLDKFSADEEVVGPAAYSLEGDCYVNLGQYDNAIDAFKKAIEKSDENPAYTPYFMMKLARVYRAQENYKAEAAIYAEIQKEYPKYGQQNGIDIEKYLDRAKLQAGE